MTILRPKIILLVLSIVLLFLFVSLAQEMSRRLQVQHEVQLLQQEVQEMQRTVISLENLNQYFRTDAYQERLAREKLNYQAPGEKVVLIPDDAFAEPAAAASAASATAAASIPERWWRAFFVPEPLNNSPS